MTSASASINRISIDRGRTKMIIEKGYMGDFGGLDSWEDYRVSIPKDDIWGIY